MQKLLEVLETVMLFLLYPAPEERKKQFELRRLHRELKYLKLSYTDIRGRRVYPALAEKTYTLFSLLNSYKKLIAFPSQRSELLKDATLLEYLILNHLNPSQKQQLASFTYEALWERIKSSINHELAWATVEREWKEVYQTFLALDRRKVNNDLFQLEVLFALSKYDFSLLLAPFSINGNIAANKSGSPQFQECAREMVLEQLLDLYYVLAGVHISPEIRGYAELLFDYYNEEGEDQEEKKHKLRDTIDRIEMLCDNEISPNTLLSVLKLLHQNSQFETSSMRLKRDYLDDTWKQIKKGYEHARNRVQRELRDQTHSIQIEKLFGEDELEEINNYNRETEKAFHDLGLSGLMYSLPLRVLATYHRRYFSKGILGALRKFHGDGFFDDEKFGKALGAAIEKGNGISELLDKFEAKLLSPVGFSMQDALELAKMSQRTGDEIERIETYLSEVNDAAHDLVSDAGRALQELNRMIEAMVDDYRVPKPRQISNIRVIGGDRNRNLFSLVETALEMQRGILNILKGYAVLGEIQEQEDQTSLPG